MAGPQNVAGDSKSDAGQHGVGSGARRRRDATSEGGADLLGTPPSSGLTTGTGVITDSGTAADNGETLHTVDDTEVNTTLLLAPSHSRKAPSRRNSATSSRRARDLARARANAELARKEHELAMARIAVLELQSESDSDGDDDGDIDRQSRTETWVDTQVTLIEKEQSTPAAQPSTHRVADRPEVQLATATQPYTHRAAACTEQHATQARGREHACIAASSLPHALPAPQRGEFYGAGERDQRTIAGPEACPPKEMKHSEEGPVQVQSVIQELAAAINNAVRAAPSSGAPKHLQDLPVFSGASSDWLPFKAAYEETACHLTETENLSRLRKSLKGVAKEVAHCLFVGATTASEVMKLLSSTFGRPDALVTAEMDKLRGLPRITDNPRDVCMFASKVVNVTATIKALGKHHYLYNSEVVRAVVEKLPPTLRYMFYNFTAEHMQDEPDLMKLKTFLEQTSERCGGFAPAEKMVPDDRREHKPPPVKKPQRGNTYHVEPQKPSPSTCPICHNEHRPADCTLLQKAEVSERWDLARKHRLCFRCLRIRKFRHMCKGKKCDIDGCTYMHHPLLHGGAPPSREAESTAHTSEVKEAVIVASTREQNVSTALLKILPVQVVGPKGAYNTYALLDDGSTCTLIESAVAEKIGANGPREPFYIKGVAGTRIDADVSQRVLFTIRGRNSEEHTISARTMADLNLSPQSVPAGVVRSCPHLRDLEDQLVYEEGTPTVLLGQDNWHLLISYDVRRGERGQPAASLTDLGWVLHGVRESSGPGLHRVNHLAARNEEEESMERLMREVENPALARAPVTELHTFVDASSSAYAAATYWRVIGEDGAVHVALIAAKGRVAPLKTTSIPRLELQAAVLGCRLAHTAMEEHDIKPTRRGFWSDSRTVLAWLRTGPRVYRPFVAHRVAEIAETTKTNEWRWVPTKDNVADDATRETPQNFDSQHRWFNGPDFLQADEESWPQEKEDKGAIQDAGNDERITLATVAMATDTLATGRLTDALPDLSRFSNWMRTMRVTARILQFIDKLRARSTCAVNYKRTRKNEENDPAWTRQERRTTTGKKEREIVGRSQLIPIEARYLHRARQLWLRAQQEDVFGPELNALENAKPLPNNSRLSQLAVIRDEEGIIRLRSRIAAAADITDAQREPAVIDGEHAWTRLYVAWVHRQLHHGGVETTINEVRQHYWVLRLRYTVRREVKLCQTCRVMKATAAQPSTGNHPPGRLAHHQRAFTFTGLDYFGPMTITVGRGTQKRYGVLFTCLTTRAVHLEFAGSLSTDSAVMALRRFISRRGCPTELWSDQGTNLKGADLELRRAAEEALQHEASVRFVRWRFIPPSAPFMGGAWERLVRSVKTALRVTLHERAPKEEVLATLLVEAEHTINSRPLTHVSTAPDDPEALTSNHFLLGGPSRVPLPGAFTEKDAAGRKEWRASQRLADMFWSRWVREYLPELQHRREPRATKGAIQLGDLVLIADGTLPRNSWPRGVVIATFPGPDGEVRAVDVRTNKGILRRPTKKLVILPATKAL